MCTAVRSFSAIWMNFSVSSISIPPGAPSIPLTLISMMKSGPTASRISCRILTGNLQRFSMLPPYSSVLLFVRGEMNCIIRKPWPPWMQMPSKPASFMNSEVFT